MLSTKQRTLCAIFIILYIIGSRIVIPIGIIPLTLQTMVFLLAGLLLPRRLIIISASIYILMGLCGFPFFANGGGISYLLQPSFGFLIALPCSACLLSTLRLRFHFTTFNRLLPVCFLSLAFIYCIGALYMFAIFHLYLQISTNLSSILSIAVLPFILSDSFSAIIACVIALRLYHVPVVKRMLSLSN